MGTDTPTNGQKGTSQSDMLWPVLLLTANYESELVFSASLLKADTTWTRLLWPVRRCQPIPPWDGARCFLVKFFALSARYPCLLTATITSKNDHFRKGQVLTQDYCFTVAYLVVLQQKKLFSEYYLLISTMRTSMNFKRSVLLPRVHFKAHALKGHTENTA